MALLTLAVLGLWARSEYRQWALKETDTLYVDFVSKRGVPRGIGPPLAADLASRRSVSYAITTKCRRASGWRGKVLEQIDGVFKTQLLTVGGVCPDLEPRVIAMRAVNGFGKPTTAHFVTASTLAESDEPAARKPVLWKYIYDEEGRIAYEVEMDRKGRQVRSLVYSPADRGSAPDRRTRQLFGADGFPLPRSKSVCAAAETVEYSPEGFETRSRYKDRFGHDAPGPYHVPVREERRDESGLLLEMASLDYSSDGTLVPVNDIFGNASIRYSDFDPFGQARRGEYRGADGELVEIDGYAIFTQSYDDVGNVTQETLFGRDGQPAAGRDGWHRRVTEYGEHGLVAQQTFWGIDGRPTSQADGCHELRLTYDEQGRSTGGECIGADGQPGGLNAPRWRIDYDADGNVSSWSYFDAAGHKTSGRDGWHRLELHYDPRGNVMVERYLDKQGRPANLWDKYSTVIYKYDALNHEIERTYRAADGLPTIVAKGYAQLRTEYDEYGNRIQERYYAADGKTPQGLEWGYTGIDFEYDGCGLETARWYVGPDGQRMKISLGYAGERRAYDRLGREIRLTYLDTSGLPVVTSEGLASWEDDLDRYGNVVEQHFLDIDGQPVLVETDAGRCAGLRWTRDSLGRTPTPDGICLDEDLHPVESDRASGNLVSPPSTGRAPKPPKTLNLGTGDPQQ